MVDPVENWRKSSRYDLRAASQMLRGGYHIYTIFFCHLAVEKMLKAVTEKVSGKTPPKTHNLRYLLERAGLKPPQDMFESIGALSDLSIPTRYPLDLESNSKTYTKERAKEYLRRAKEAVRWIEKSLGS